MCLLLCSKLLDLACALAVHVQDVVACVDASGAPLQVKLHRGERLNVVG